MVVKEGADASWPSWQEARKAADNRTFQPSTLRPWDNLEWPILITFWERVGKLRENAQKLYRDSHLSSGLNQGT